MWTNFIIFKKNKVMNVDVEIYLNQFKTFFDNNPNSLKELIGEIDTELFYNKVKEVCYLNDEKGDDVSLTRTQIIDIVVSLIDVVKTDNIETKVNGVFEKTKFGDICMNWFGTLKNYTYLCVIIKTN